LNTERVLRIHHHFYEWTVAQSHRLASDLGRRGMRHHHHEKGTMFLTRSILIGDRLNKDNCRRSTIRVVWGLQTNSHAHALTVDDRQSVHTANTESI